MLTGNVSAFTNSAGRTGTAFGGSHRVVVAGSAGSVAMADGTWTAAGTATHAGSIYESARTRRTWRNCRSTRT